MNMYLTRKQAKRLHAFMCDILLVNFQVTDAEIAEHICEKNPYYGEPCFDLTMNNGLILHGAVMYGTPLTTHNHLPPWVYFRFDGDDTTIRGLGLSDSRLNPHSFKWNWHPSGTNDNELVYMGRCIYNVIQRCSGIKGLAIY